MKRNEILGEHKKGTKAVKYNKKPKDHATEFSKAKEKLAPVKPMEGYNPNSVDAQHRRSLDQSHAADLKARAEGPDATERDQQRYQNYLDKKEQMRNDYNDRMERESVAQEGRWDRRDAYQRDYDSSQRGMGRRDFGYDDAGYSLAPGHDEGEPVYSRAHDRIGHGGPTARREPAADVPHDVYIDGRKWKTFGSASHASNVARKLQANGKSVSVKASSTDEAIGTEVGKITKVDPATKKATLTKPDGTSMEVDSTALKPTPDGKMQMDTPDTDELKTGVDVVSTSEDFGAPTTDSSSPINGDEENVDLRRLRELAGQPAAPVTDVDPGEQILSVAATPEVKAFIDANTVRDAEGDVDIAGTFGQMITKASANMDVKGLQAALAQMEVKFKEFPTTPEFQAMSPEDQAEWKQKAPEGVQTMRDMTAQLVKLQQTFAAGGKQMTDFSNNPNATKDNPMKGVKSLTAPPVEEGELSEAGEGMSDDYLQKAASGAPGRWMISQDKAKEELARRAAGGKQNVPEPKDAESDSAPFVPKDYQTKEPLTKGPDGKWRNSKGEERDSLHGGPISAGGGAMFRSLTPRPPTQESAELTAMLRIAGLR